MEEEKKDKGFVIKDRRLFDESGAARVEEEMKPEAMKAIQTEYKTFLEDKEHAL